MTIRWERARHLAMGALAAGALAGSAAAQPHGMHPAGMARLEARLQRAEDMLEIQQLLGQYTVAIDAKDWDAYSALFADDGELIFTGAHARGAAEIRAVMARASPPNVRHLTTNIVIKVDGDRATAHSRWTALGGDAENRVSVGGTGSYEDELVRQRGRWRFQRRVVYGDFPTRDPLAAK